MQIVYLVWFALFRGYQAVATDNSITTERKVSNGTNIHGRHALKQHDHNSHVNQKHTHDNVKSFSKQDIYQIYNETLHLSHKKVWHHYAEVKGLKNEDVVVLISSTAIRNWFYIRSRVIQSARTWMRLLANVFVIIEDTFQIRIAMRHCKMTDYARFTTFECHNEPIYILSRKCTNAYYFAQGPCCKIDELMSYITNDRPDLYSHLKYAVQLDDDTYIRVDQMMKWLASIEKSGINSYPIIAQGGRPHEKLYGLKSGCEEIHPQGWYQPYIVNHAAMERMKNAHTAYGLKDTCKTFGVSQDVGVGPFAWMFGLYRLYIPGVIVSNGKEQGVDIGPTHMFIHSLKHMEWGDNCNDTSDYNQWLNVGCGDINKPYHGHEISPQNMKINANMYDAWEYYRVHGQEVNVQQDLENRPLWSAQSVILYPNGTMLEGVSTRGDEYKDKIKHILTAKETESVTNGTFEGQTVVSRFIPLITPFVGYETTMHSKKYDVVKEWQTFKLSDCKIHGVVRNP